ncbi:MAG: CCA tRNA nucleotidyltransferase [Firmicutes bacterium]|nr:CCA tRNA nucleotidyltransferase [Bacillota bacterium]
MRALEGRGFEAYLVGGAVRDLLLGKKPEDYDLVTTAPPESVQKIAALQGWPALETGRAFGVLTVLVQGRPLEVATARTEWYGRDSHRPAGVRFSASIDADLARRDFTINAMAMDLGGRITDPFGGQRDLAAGQIRAVGNAAERFKEDALRPFRAVRFAAQLGFELDEQLLRAIPGALYRIDGLAVERVRAELEKILLAPQARRGFELLVYTGLADASCRYRAGGSEKKVPILPELKRLRGLPQNPRYHRFDVLKHTLLAVEAAPFEPTLRWAALLHDVAKGLPGVRGRNKHGGLTDRGHDRVGAEIAAGILSRLRLPASLRKRVIWLVRNHMVALPAKRATLIRWLKRRSRSFGNQAELQEAVQQLFALRRADLAAGIIDPAWQKVREVEQMLKQIFEELPFYVAELEISGGEVAQKLGGGPQVGKFLADLLDRVIAGRLPNRREFLQTALERRVRRLGLK